MNWIAILIAGAGIIAIFVCSAVFGNKIQKRKDRENEIKSKPADTVVDNLDNSDDVRRVIDQGRDRFSNRIRGLLLRIGTSLANLVNRRGSK